jgi:hypothetical protein
MKSPLLAVLITLLTLQTRAQITLEHAYSDSMKTWMQCTMVEGEGYKYYGFDAVTRSVQVYNADHSLWKTINLAIPSSAILGAGNNSVAFLSKRLFNLDTNVELLVRYTIVGPPGTGYTYFNEIWGEAGLVFTFPTTAGHSIALLELARHDSTFKMLVHHSGTSQFTQVYSLVGTVPTGAKEIILEDDNSLTVYPNPASSLVHVRFRQPATASYILVRNTVGSLVLQQPVTHGSREIQIDMSQYPAGQYFFEAVEENGRTVRGRFEKL